jgi:hypothetical protein
MAPTVKTMKAITIRQPWADAVVNGRKQVENRSRRTNFRGMLLIHAGRACEDTGDTCPDGSPVPEEFYFGAVVGVANLADCKEYTDEEFGDDPWASGPWCWILKDTKAFHEPLDRGGQLGLWNCEVSAALVEQLRQVGIPLT